MWARLRLLGLIRLFTKEGARERVGCDVEGCSWGVKDPWMY
jgi:hypothetical protein